MKRAVVISDETGNVGDRCWDAVQPLFIQGALVIEDASISDVTHVTRAVRKRLRLDHLHMAEYRIDDKRRIADGVLKGLEQAGLRWTWIEFVIERRFYPATYLADFIFSELQYRGEPFRENIQTNAVTDLLANIHFPMSVKQAAWEAILTDSPRALFECLVDLRIALHSRRNSCAFSEMVDDQLGKLLAGRDESFTRLLLDHPAYRPTFNNFQFKSFVQTMLGCKRYLSGCSSVDVVIEHEAQLERRLELAAENSYEIPYAETLQWDRDKAVTEFADVFLWLSRRYHDYQIGSVKGTKREPRIPADSFGKIMPDFSRFKTMGIGRESALTAVRAELPRGLDDPVFRALYEAGAKDQHLLNERIDGFGR